MNKREFVEECNKEIRRMLKEADKEIEEIDYETSYPNKGGKKHLTEQEYYWIKSHMSSMYGMTEESNEELMTEERLKELKNKINKKYGKKEVE